MYGRYPNHMQQGGRAKRAHPACNDYYCMITYIFVGQDKPLSLNEMITIAQSYQQHQCKFIS